MIWFDYDNSRWMSKLGYYVYFIFGTRENFKLDNDYYNIDINDVVFIGVGKDDFAIKHAQGELERDDAIIKEHRTILNLDEINHRIENGRPLTVRILMHNLLFEVATKLRSLCTNFLCEFKFGMSWTKEQSQYYFEQNFFDENLMPMRRYSVSGMKGYYLYTLNDNQNDGCIIYVGLGKRDFAWKHVNGAVTKKDYDTFGQMGGPNMNCNDYDDFMWQYEQNIKELFGENRIDFYIVREGLSQYQARLHHLVFRYLYVFYIQSRYRRRKPPYGNRFKWEVGFRTVEEAFWYFYDDSWTIVK